MSTSQTRADGGSLGLLGSGWVDVKTQELGLNGTVIPLSKINKLVGIIPLLGKAVVGKDGKGIMAIDYTVKGTLSKPEASIRKESLTTDVLEETLDSGEEAIPSNQQ